MGNVLDMDKQTVIKQLISLGWSDRKISKSIKINRRTVARYRSKLPKTSPDPSEALLEGEESGIERCTRDQSAPLSGDIKCPPTQVVHFEVPADPSLSRSHAAPYHDQIIQKLRAGQSGQSIYQDLVVESEYQGSYDSVKRYIHKLLHKHPRLYARLETAPGEEAQVDFGQGAPTLKNGRYHKPWLFVMVLSHGRGSYEEVVWQQDVETFIRCHERAFEALGGIPRTVLIDNLKSGVLKAHLYEPTLNPLYKAYADHAGFTILPCRVATPEHKGKVESNVDYVQDNALTGKRFTLLDDQNSYLRNWNRRWASTRIHGTVKRQVRLMHEEEQPYLQPLPSASFSFFKVARRKVSVYDSHIEVKGAFYPVPPEHMGKYVDVQYTQEWVKVLAKGQVIQCLSTIDKGRFHPDKRCLPANKGMDRNTWQQNLMQQCKQAGVFIHTWAEAVIHQKDLAGYRAIQGVLSLLKKYRREDVNQACKRAHELNATSYHQVKVYLSEQLLKMEQPSPDLQQTGDIIRSLKDYNNLIGGLL